MSFLNLVKTVIHMIFSKLTLYALKNVKITHRLVGEKDKDPHEFRLGVRCRVYFPRIKCVPL